MWYTYALLAALFAALTAVFAKIGIKNVDSDLATAIRTIIILIIAWLIVLLKGSICTWTTLTKTNWLFLGLSGIATGLSWVFYFKALQIGKVSLVASVDKLSVAIAIILSAIFLKEVLTLRTILGAALIIVGTFILVWK